MTQQVLVLDYYSLASSLSAKFNFVTKYIPESIKRFFNRQMAIMGCTLLSKEIKDLEEKAEGIAGANNLSAINGAGLTQLALEYGTRQEFLLRIAKQNGARKIKLGLLEVWV